MGKCKLGHSCKRHVTSALGCSEKWMRVLALLSVYGRVWIKMLVKENRIHIGTWNIQSLTRKLMEIVDTTTRRMMKIVCLVGR